MDLRHLKLIAAVDEHGSLTRAAEQLHVTQSALSHQLREAETIVGASLFHRVNRRMVLTPVGVRVLESAHNIINELEQVDRDVRELVDGTRGVVRVSTECYTVYHWLPGLMATFREEHPAVDVEIVAEATRRPTEFLMDGRLDVAITGSSRKRVVDKHFKHDWLLEDEMFVVSSLAHPFADRAWVEAKDFAKENVLTYTMSPEEIGFFRRVLIPAGVTPRRITRIELTEGIIEMVKSNIGVAVMAGWAIRPVLDNKAVCATRITRSGLKRHWFATTLKVATPTRHLTSFVDHLKRRAQVPTRTIGESRRTPKKARKR